MKKILLISMLLFTVFLFGCSNTEEIKSCDDPVNDLFPVEDNRVECPSGIHDDPAPGACGIYHDGNSDGFCDYSE